MLPRKHSNISVDACSFSGASGNAAKNLKFYGNFWTFLSYIYIKSSTKFPKVSFLASWVTICWKFSHFGWIFMTTIGPYVVVNSTLKRLSIMCMHPRHTHHGDSSNNSVATTNAVGHSSGSLSHPPWRRRCLHRPWCRQWHHRPWPMAMAKNIHGWPITHRPTVGPDGLSTAVPTTGVEELTDCSIGLELLFKIGVDHFFWKTVDCGVLLYGHGDGRFLLLLLVMGMSRDELNRSARVLIFGERVALHSVRCIYKGK